MDKCWLIFLGIKIILRDFIDDSNNEYLNTFKLYGPFLLMGFNCFKVTEPLFNTKFPEIPGTHLINLGRMTG